ncbi:class I SAM-dependent methyltransferase [bacterium]|nr:MAG: class I SAM-dependent methyltransferase [bacterium]
MAVERVHRGFGRNYSGFIKIFSRLSYLLFSAGADFSRLLLDGLRIGPSSRVLDVGCGVGNLIADIQKKADSANPGAALFAVDRSWEMIKIARSRLSAGPRRVYFVACDALNLPFKPESFDISFTVLFLHHLMPEPKIRVLSECRSALKNNGTIVLMDMDKPDSIIGMVLAFSRRHIPMISSNCELGLEHFFKAAGLRAKWHMKKLGIFSYYRLEKL